MTASPSIPIHPRVRIVDGLSIRYAESRPRDEHALLLCPWFGAADHPGRFRTLVVGTGATSYPLELGEPLSSWVAAPDLEPYRRRDPRQFVAAALANIDPTYQLPDRIREDYLSAYDGDRFVEPMRYVHAYPGELPVLRYLLPEVQTPVQIIAGIRDTAIPPSNAEFLHARLPHSKLDVIDARHFAWEDNPTEYARLVTGWWAAQHAPA